MTQDTGKIVTPTLSSKSPKGSKGFTEVKILKRGRYYMTPFTLRQLDEVVNNLSDENKHELALLGHTDLEQAIIEMYETSECYLVRAEGESFIAVGGLFYSDDQQYPQMFCMFSDKIKKHLNWSAKIDLNHGLKKYYKWVKSIPVVKKLNSFHPFFKLK